MSNRLPRPLLKRDIEAAIANSMSAAGAARYLGVNYITYRKYAKLYGLFQTNPTGKGIKKVSRKGAAGLDTILGGQHPNYSHRRLKERLVRAGMLKNECYLCGYKETRPDGRGPFILNCIDGDQQNLKLENLELRCFNCWFLTTGRLDPKTVIGAITKQQDAIQALPEGTDIEELQREALEELGET